MSLVRAPAAAGGAPPRGAGHAPGGHSMLAASQTTMTTTTTTTSWSVTDAAADYGAPSQYTRGSTSDAAEASMYNRGYDYEPHRGLLHQHQDDDTSLSRCSTCGRTIDTYSTDVTASTSSSICTTCEQAAARAGARARREASEYTTDTTWLSTSAVTSCSCSSCVSGDTTWDGQRHRARGEGRCRHPADESSSFTSSSGDTHPQRQPKRYRGRWRDDPAHDPHAAALGARAKDVAERAAAIAEHHRATTRGFPRTHAVKYAAMVARQARAQQVAVPPPMPAAAAMGTTTTVVATTTREAAAAAVEPQQDTSASRAYLEGFNRAVELLRGGGGGGAAAAGDDALQAPRPLRVEQMGRTLVKDGPAGFAALAARLERDAVRDVPSQPSESEFSRESPPQTGTSYSTQHHEDTLRVRLGGAGGAGTPAAAGVAELSHPLSQSGTTYTSPPSGVDVDADTDAASNRTKPPPRDWQGGGVAAPSPAGVNGNGNGHGNANLSYSQYIAPKALQLSATSLLEASRMEGNGASVVPLAERVVQPNFDLSTYLESLLPPGEQGAGSGDGLGVDTSGILRTVSTATTMTVTPQQGPGEGGPAGASPVPTLARGGTGEAPAADLLTAPADAKSLASGSGSAGGGRAATHSGTPSLPSSININGILGSAHDARAASERSAPSTATSGGGPLWQCLEDALGRAERAVGAEGALSLPTTVGAAGARAASPDGDAYNPLALGYNPLAQPPPVAASGPAPGAAQPIAIPTLELTVDTDSSSAGTRPGSARTGTPTPKAPPNVPPLALGPLVALSAPVPHGDVDVETDPGAAVVHAALVAALVIVHPCVASLSVRRGAPVRILAHADLTPIVFPPTPRQQTATLTGIAAIALVALAARAVSTSMSRVPAASPQPAPADASSNAAVTAGVAVLLCGAPVSMPLRPPTAPEGEEEGDMPAAAPDAGPAVSVPGNAERTVGAAAVAAAVAAVVHTAGAGHPPPPPSATPAGASAVAAAAVIAAESTAALMPPPPPHARAALAAAVAVAAAALPGAWHARAACAVRAVAAAAAVAAAGAPMARAAGTTAAPTAAEGGEGAAFNPLAAPSPAELWRVTADRDRAAADAAAWKARAIRAEMAAVAADEATARRGIVAGEEATFAEDVRKPHARTAWVRRRARDEVARMAGEDHTSAVTAQLHAALAEIERLKEVDAENQRVKAANEVLTRRAEDADRLRDRLGVVEGRLIAVQTAYEEDQAASAARERVLKQRLKNLLQLQAQQEALRREIVEARGVRVASFDEGVEARFARVHREVAAAMADTRPGAAPGATKPTPPTPPSPGAGVGRGIPPPTEIAPSRAGAPAQAAAPQSPGGMSILEHEEVAPVPAVGATAVDAGAPVLGPEEDGDARAGAVAAAAAGTGALDAPPDA